MHAPARAGDISFYIAVIFLLGVFAANSGWGPWMLIGTGAGIIIGGYYFFDRNRPLAYAGMFCSALMVGALYYHAYAYWQAVHTKLPPGKTAAFFGRITEEPKLAGNFMMETVELLSPCAGTVDVFTSPKGIQFQYGDEVWMRGAVVSSDDASEPPMLFLPRMRVVIQHQGFWLKEIVVEFKEEIVRRIAQMLPADQAALLSGILIGTAGTVNAALKAQMETSGTTYIVNMFGYKIAILTAALAAALKDHISRRALLWASLAAIALFVFTSGGTTSAIRAAVMGSFAVIARGTGRVVSARNAVAFAALGMVLANATLLTDAGFQLSFLSFLGIYYLGPPIDNFFHWTDGGMLDWKSHAMLSLTTNLAILPIVMNVFGEFSLTSFISNVFIMIPWVAVIGFGAAALLVGIVSSALAFCVAQLVSLLLQYELFIVHLFAVVAVPLPPAFGSPFVTASYYGVLVLFAYYYAPSSQKIY